MKKILTLLIIVLSIQVSFGQACGKYRIKYVGSIEAGDDILKVKLPKTKLLHDIEDDSLKTEYIEVDIQDNKIEFEMMSHMTSNLYDNPKSLKDFYKSKADSITIKIFSISKNDPTEISIKIDWDRILITKLDDKGFGNLFQLDLGDIKRE